MRVVDLNVLLYAVNEEAPHHRPVLSWLETALGGEEPVGIPWIVLLGFLRLATSPSVFPRPLTLEVALAQVDSWLACENVRILRETDEHWRLLRSLVAIAGAAGNLTTDAHLAALSISHGAVLASCDHDFSRFRDLRWENPAA